MIREIPPPTVEIQGPVEPIDMYRVCIRELQSYGMHTSESQLRMLAPRAEDADELLAICRLFVIIRIF